jgi:hypothetical protein
MFSEDLTRPSVYSDDGLHQFLTPIACDPAPESLGEFLPYSNAGEVFGELATVNKAVAVTVVPHLPVALDGHLRHGAGRVPFPTTTSCLTS